MNDAYHLPTCGLKMNYILSTIGGREEQKKKGGRRGGKEERVGESRNISSSGQSKCDSEEVRNRSKAVTKLGFTAGTTGLWRLCPKYCPG